MQPIQVVPCEVNPIISENADAINAFIRSACAAKFGVGLSEEEFCSTPAFTLALERARGQNAATIAPKRAFIAAVLNHMVSCGYVAGWEDTTSQGRHDYSLTMRNGIRVAIEAKGNLDGNSSSIFERPDGYDEFYVWSLSSNAGTDLRKGVWSGIHTRLGAHMISECEQVDGLIVLDQTCGSPDRVCPKIAGHSGGTAVGDYRIPPPCLFSFPKVVPSLGFNQAQSVGNLEFASAFHECFQGNDAELTYVDYEVVQAGKKLARQTTIRRGNSIVKRSGFNKLNRKQKSK